MLIAADDALTSAAEARYLTSRKKVDKKLRELVDLLSRFERDFKNSMSGPSIDGMVTTEANPKSPLASMVLQTLKDNLHAKVKCPFVSLSLNTDES